ncbi:MAG: hypothetical protein L0Y68_00135, partial [Candidatus Dadabacteria bacterium]|nr:hypothetical protein [Candidatus Dadabacteria bacterium]
MSFPWIRVTPAFLITIAVFLFLFFASFIIASKVIVPNKISGYIEEAFKNKVYDIDIEDVEFNILSGVKVNEIKIFDLKNPTNSLISIKKIDVKPDIPYFLLNRKIKLRAIKIDKPSFTATKDGLEKLVRLVKEKEEIATSKKGKFSQIEVEHIEITNAEIRLLPGLSLSSKKFLVDFVDAVSKEDRALNLSGLINLQKSEIEVEGRINPFLAEPIGEIRLKAHELNTEGFFKGLEPTEKVDVASTLSFKISDRISSKGEVDIIPTSDNGKEVRPLFGKVQYDLAFDKKTETAFINSLSLNIFDLIHLSFTGTVEKLQGEGVFNLEGSGKNIRLEKLEGMSERFPKFSRFNFS